MFSVVRMFLPIVFEVISMSCLISKSLKLILIGLEYSAVFVSNSINIIILNGELIIGTQIRQDRIVDSTVLIPGYATVLINTFCGEQYRWSHKLSNKISKTETLYFSSGRANNAADTNTKLSKQCRIWSEISEKISDFNVKSFTNSVDQIYKKKKVNVEEIVNFFKIPSEAVGVVLGINNQLVNIDIFSNNCMLQIYLPKIIRSIFLKLLFSNINFHI